MAVQKTGESIRSQHRAVRIAGFVLTKVTHNIGVDTRGVE
jgi:hypothetical protein